MYEFVGTGIHFVCNRYSDSSNDFNIIVCGRLLAFVSLESLNLSVEYYSVYLRFSRGSFVKIVVKSVDDKKVGS